MTFVKSPAHTATAPKRVSGPGRNPTPTTHQLGLPGACRQYRSPSFSDPFARVADRSAPDNAKGNSLSDPLERPHDLVADDRRPHVQMSATAALGVELMVVVGTRSARRPVVVMVGRRTACVNAGARTVRAVVERHIWVARCRRVDNALSKPAARISDVVAVTRITEAVCVVRVDGSRRAVVSVVGTEIIRIGAVVVRRNLRDCQRHSFGTHGGPENCPCRT